MVPTMRWILAARILIGLTTCSTTAPTTTKLREQHRVWKQTRDANQACACVYKTSLTRTPCRFEVLNLGVSGSTATRNDSYTFWGTEEYEELLSTDVDLIILTLGTNDAKLAGWDRDRFARDYVALVASVRAANPGAMLTIGLPVPYQGTSLWRWAKYWGYDGTFINRELHSAVLDVAQKVNASVVDFYHTLGGELPNATLYSDPVHPNDRGRPSPRLSGSKQRRRTTSQRR